MENMSGISIMASILWSFLPVWIGIIVVFAVSMKYKQSLGLYGKLFNSTVGMIGLGLL
jgi:peptide/nickel transport system permease protein